METLPGLSRRVRWSFLMPPEEHGFIRLLQDRYHGLLTPVGRVVLALYPRVGQLLAHGRALHQRAPWL